ncbi:hypothetical protein [Tateyamaria sp.]
MDILFLFPVFVFMGLTKTRVGGFANRKLPIFTAKLVVRRSFWGMS